MDYEAFKATAMNDGSPCEPSTSNDITRPPKRGISGGLVALLGIAAFVGFTLLQCDVNALHASITGNSGRPGHRNIVWQSFLDTIGVDMAAYRGKRMKHKNLKRDYANDSWVDDLQMMVNDSLGPNDEEWRRSQ